MNKKGFTVIELLIVFVIIAGGITLFFSIVFMANPYVTESRALKAVQVVNTNATKVVNLERHFFGYSRAISEDDEGYRTTYNLNSNILFNVRAIPVN